MTTDNKFSEITIRTMANGWLIEEGNGHQPRMTIPDFNKMYVYTTKKDLADGVTKLIAKPFEEKE